MRVGLQLGNYTWEGGPDAIAGTLREIAQVADEGGFASLWVVDHLFQISSKGPAENEMLEAWSTLAYLAGLTRRIKLGPLVSGATYRHPGLLVKTVTTLDVLSRGRAVFGIGAAWFEREHRGLGIPFPERSERFQRLEEILQITKRMWGEGGAHEGHYYHLAEAICSPKPLQRPHPPILVGGMGERRTLRLVAEYADACNLFSHEGIDVVRHKLEVLAEHCDAVGRNFDEIERTALSTIHLGPAHMSIADVIAHCRALAEVGVQQVIFELPDVHEQRSLERLAREVIPTVNDF